MRFFFFLFLFFASPMANSTDELSSPVFLSQGGAGGASLKENLSYLINPATMGFQNKAKGSVSYSFKTNKQTVLLSFLDLKTKIPLALTYQRFWSDSFRNSEKDKVFISSGFQASPYLSLGFTLEKELKPSVWNGSLGSVLRLGNQLSCALFLNQILKMDNKNQRSLSIAFYYNWKHFFSTQLDISKTAHQQWIFRGGLESVFQKFFSVRLGGTWLQKTQAGLISGGVAFYSPKLLLEYSVQTDQKIYQQAVTLTLRI